MYEENYRLEGELSDATPIEHLEWRNESSDPWQKEAQLIEPVEVSPEWPEGIQVYWLYFTNLNDVLAMTETSFKAASFPRKPGKRGGTPAG